MEDMTMSERLEIIKVLVSLRAQLTSVAVTPTSKKLIESVDMKIEALMGPLG